MKYYCIKRHLMLTKSMYAYLKKILLKVRYQLDLLLQQMHPVHHIKFVPDFGEVVAEVHK